MKVSNINSVNKQSSTNFKSLIREVYKSNTSNSLTKELLYRNNTWFYRDFRWEKAINFIANRYKDISKVNMYSFGCSNGSDPYSFMMSIFSMLKEDGAKKFMPFYGIDCDEYVISCAKSGKIDIKLDEKISINKYTQDKMDNFFTHILADTYQVNPILRDNIIFSKGDILKDYKKIEPKNSIVMARNFWPYLNVHNRINLAQNLYNQLDNSSLLIVGEYDLINFDKSLYEILFNVGFLTTNLFGIFVKDRPRPNFKLSI